MQQCLNCGRELTADAIARGYCPSCGAPVTAQPAPAPAAQPPPAYPQYTPPASGGYGQPTYSQPLAYQGPDQPQQPPYQGQPSTPEPPQPPQQPLPYQNQPTPPEQAPQSPAYPPQPPYPSTGTPPAYPPASTPYPGQLYPGQQYPPSSSYQGQPGADATPGYPQPSTPYQPGITGAYPQQPGTGAYPQQPGITGAYPQQPGTGAYPQQPGITGAYPQQPGTGGYMPPQGTGAYPPGMYPGYPPTLPPPARPSNNSTIIGLVAAFIVVVLLAGTLFILGKSGSGPLANAFATATPAATSTPIPTNTPVPTATPAVPSGFSAFSSPDGSYSIDYPQDWAKQDVSTSGITSELFSSGLGDAFQIIPGAPSTPSNQYADVLKAFLTNASNVQVAATTQSATIGANTWTTVTATGTISGTAFNAVLYGADHGGATTFVITLSPKTRASVANSQYFQPMLQSFTFLK